MPAPENRAHPQQEFLQVKRLRQVVIAPGLEPAHAVGGISPGGITAGGRRSATKSVCPHSRAGASASVFAIWKRGSATSAFTLGGGNTSPAYGEVRGSSTSPLA